MPTVVRAGRAWKKERMMSSLLRSELILTINREQLVLKNEITFGSMQNDTQETMIVKYVGTYAYKLNR